MKDPNVPDYKVCPIADNVVNHTMEIRTLQKHTEALMLVVGDIKAYLLKHKHLIETEELP